MRYVRKYERVKQVFVDMDTCQVMIPLNCEFFVGTTNSATYGAHFGARFGTNSAVEEMLLKHLSLEHLMAVMSDQRLDL